MTARGATAEHLAEAIHEHAKKLDRRGPGFIFGTVVSVQATVPPTLTITVAGSTVQVPGIPYCESYSPSGMDQVLIALLGNGDMVVIDALAGS
jgi:hypothetical protein